MNVEAQVLVDELQSSVIQLTLENIQLRAVIKSLTKGTDESQDDEE